MIRHIIIINLQGSDFPQHQTVHAKTPISAFISNNARQTSPKNHQVFRKHDPVTAQPLQTGPLHSGERERETSRCHFLHILTVEYRRPAPLTCSTVRCGTWGPGALCWSPAGRRSWGRRTARGQPLTTPPHTRCPRAPRTWRWCCPAGAPSPFTQHTESRTAHISLYSSESIALNSVQFNVFNALFNGLNKVELTELNLIAFNSTDSTEMNRHAFCSTEMNQTE